VLLTTRIPANNPNLPANLLSILERLNTFPTDHSELNSWWVEELGVKPQKPAAHDVEDGDESQIDEINAEEDWRTFFDDDTPKYGASEQMQPSTRLHKLTAHQSLHSLAAHRAVFTRTWLLLLPHLFPAKDYNNDLSIRALNVMHRGVLPHLTRPILVLDWVGACVDHGTLFCLPPWGSSKSLYVNADGYFEVE